MNPMIHFMKKQSLKVCLPLLLLATACGDGTSSSFQASDALPPVSEIAGATPTASKLATGGGSTVPVAADAGDLDLDSESGIDGPGQPDVVAPGGKISDPVAVTKVPEPTAIAGLAITALGLVAIKRKRVAA